MQQDKNLRAPLMTPRGEEATMNKSQSRAILGKLTSKFTVKVQDEMRFREILLHPTLWNKIKVFFANIYETFLIIIGLALSIYQDDLSSFIYQLLMLTVLYYSKRDEGKYVPIQKKICIGTLFALICFMGFKYVYMGQLEPVLTARIKELRDDMKVLGYQLVKQEDETFTFDKWKTFEFEIFASVVCILLITYYNGFAYIHHSEFLKQHELIYKIFFITLFSDTFFSHTIIQMIVSAIMMIITIVWALNHPKTAYVFEKAVSFINGLLKFQLIMLAMVQVQYLIDWIKTMPGLYNAMFISGLILNEQQAVYAIVHIFSICIILGFGSLYASTEANYQNYVKTIGQYTSQSYQEEKIKRIEKEKKTDGKHKDDDEGQTKVVKKTAFSSIRNFDYKKFTQNYERTLCMWGIRIVSLIFSYAYHGTPALVILTWVLFSFMFKLDMFAKCTVYFYLPIFFVGFFYTYLINIPGLFLTYQDGKQILYYPDLYNTFGRSFRFPVVETAGLTLNLIFLILLLRKQSSDQLGFSNDEIKKGIFDKMTDYQSVFLWQLCFYIMKRWHILILCLIFYFGMRELNIYYIGLMYFFVMYVSSLATYRKSGQILVFYAAFFIWIQYFWSLVSASFDSSGFIYKIFMMLTFQKYNEPKDGLGSLNQYLEYDIPTGQWVIFLLQVLMALVNDFFRASPNGPYIANAIDGSGEKNYTSMADYYEEKCDFVLRKKFPGSARLLIRVRIIFSEMMIISILITQGFILVLQPPNLMFWGFLIFSLTLQTAVVSASDESNDMLKRCATQSMILKLYSGFVLIAQIAYHFINDKSFLAQYGFDEILNYILGDLNEYMTIIGFENYQNSTRSIFAIFVSQILFYITACILEDYFRERLIENQKKEELDNSIKLRITQVFRVDTRQNDNEDKNDGYQESQENLLDQDGKSTVSVGKKSTVADHLILSPVEKVKYDYESIRFTIPYMIYQRISSWRVMDSIALNFHLVTATVTIILCTNWQISLFMSFYLLCNVILCIRAAKELHKNGKQIYGLQEKEKNLWQAPQDNDSSQRAKPIAQPKTTFNDIDINQAHQTNKSYMRNASGVLLKVRTEQWTFQYWLLIISMIIMYPTPILADLKQKMTPDQQVITNDAIFWLFWGGVYISPEDVQNISNHAPLYVMLILLIFEKSAQRWQQNRYGCTINKVKEFKVLEEKLLIIKNEGLTEQNKEPINPRYENLKSNKNHNKTEEEKSQVYSFITIMEAKEACYEVEKLYREKTTERKEQRLKETLSLAIQRKYTMKVRSGLKFLMEQLSLQLLLFSCANKSNLVSILYLGLLLMFLLIKDKTTGMLIMSFAFGTTLALEYIISLTNFTSLVNPMPFPAPYDEGYPSKEFPLGQFIFPWFLKVDFLKNNLQWTNFFSIDLQSAQVNDIWFDFANLVIITIYFFNFGNPITAKNIKVSFSQTRELEETLNKYAKIQQVKKYILKHPKKVSEIGNEKEEKKLKQSDAKINSYFKDQDIDYDNLSEKACDDSMEQFLGSTYYLSELKKSTFIYTFNKKMKYFAFIGLQIVTLIMTFLLAMLCRSLMSLGYMIMCVPLIIQITDFFYQDSILKGKTWKHRSYITGPLMIFSFVDISLQIFCQAPFYSGDYFQRQLGFDKVYTVNKDISFMEMLYAGEEGYKFISLAEGGMSLMFLTLKSINLFFIFMQSRIYRSDSFDQFMREDLRSLLKLASNYKRLAMTYRYNNWKLQKIVSVQEKKSEMEEGVEKLKVKMYQYKVAQEHLFSLLPQPSHPSLKTTNKSPLLNQPSTKLHTISEKDEHPEEQKTSDLEQNQNNDNLNTSTGQIGSYGEQDTQNDGYQVYSNEMDPKKELELRNPFKHVEYPPILKAKPQSITAQKIIMQLASTGFNYNPNLHPSLLRKQLKLNIEKREAFKKMKTQVGRCGNYYLCLRKKHVNQILFINSIEKAQEIKLKMEKGHRDIDCDLERLMKKDIEIFYLKKQNLIDDENEVILQESIKRYVSEKQKAIETTLKMTILGVKKRKTEADEEMIKQLQEEKRQLEIDHNDLLDNDLNRTLTTGKMSEKMRKRLKIKIEEEEVSFKDMHETTSFLKCSSILLGLIGALFEAAFSKMAFIAYSFMILSQVLNAGLVSILLPFAVFGYALMEECRPGQFFWDVIKKYVLAILFLKFIINLDFLFDNKDLVDTYISISNWLLFGLWRVEGIWNLFIYILPEIIILASIMAQNYYEILIGLYDIREIDIENIYDARERYYRQYSLNSNKEDSQVPKEDKKKLLEEQDNKEIKLSGQEIKDFNYKQLHKSIKKVFKNHNKDDKANENNQLKKAEKIKSDLAVDCSSAQRLRKEFFDEIDQNLLNHGLDRQNTMIDDQKTLRSKAKELKKNKPENQGLVRNYFGKKGYFRRLFPKIKEQKPGIDFYGKITFVQFVICIYLISYYTKLDARGTQNLENSSQFSIYMVIMLFVQVFVMILERYISRTNTRINVTKARKENKDKKERKNTTQATTKKSVISAKTTGVQTRSTSIRIQAHKTSDTILFNVGEDKSTVKDIEIKLQHTRMTKQQVSKWVIQWILLILYHALVFWIFPLSSNDAIYGTPYCDTTSNLYAKYGCLSFKQNWYLIIFYCIFCYYFMLSALQIRFGYPDYKEPSSLTSTGGLGPVLLYRVFYNLPFIFELKIILDWCFQKTSLDIFQWLELAEIDSELYFFKNGNKGYFERKLGTKIVRFEKCLCGCFCLGVILFFLVGPFLMFSNLSYIADTNLVTDAYLDFQIKIEDQLKQETYEFPIFYTDNPLSLLNMEEKEFYDNDYGRLPETKFFEASQVQKIVMKNSSDIEWTVSGDYRNLFKELVSQTAHGSDHLETTLEVSYSFTRPGPAEAPVSVGKHVRVLDLDNPEDEYVIDQLHDAMRIDCVANPNDIRNVNIKDFIPYQLRLGEQKDVIDLNLTKENVTLSYSCQNFWALNVNLQGLLFITFSDLISSNFFDATSIMGFYLGVAVIVGQTLRKIVVFNADRIFITEIPDPDPIRNLVRAIYMQRLQQNLEQEEELFMILLELLRSPEMIRKVCPSSLRAELIKDPKKREKYQIQKEEDQRPAQVLSA